MSDYCMLFSQTFYGVLFSYLTITDVTSYVHHKFPVSLVLYIATKKLNQIMAVNSSANAPIKQKKQLLHALRAYQVYMSEQGLRFRSHLYKHNSTCFMTQVIRRYRVLCT